MKFLLPNIQENKNQLNKNMKQLRTNIQENKKLV